MDHECNIVQLKSKIFLSPYKNVWFKATMTIDIKQKVLTVHRYSPFLTESIDGDEYCLDGIVSPTEVVEPNIAVEPSEIDLTQFKLISRHSKIKQKIDNVACYCFELSTSKKLNKKILKIGCYLEEVFDFYYSELKKIMEENYNIQSTKRNSLSASVISNNLLIQEMKSKKVLKKQDSSSSNVVVVATNENIANSCGACILPENMTNVNCQDIYQDIRSSCLFPVTFHSQEKIKNSDVISWISLHHESKYNLYLDDRKFFVLNENAIKVLYNWKFCHIKSFGYSTNMIHVETGPLCKTGIAAMIFSFFDCKKCARFVEKFKEKYRRDRESSIECMCSCKTTCIECRHGNDVYTMPTNHKENEQDGAINKTYMMNESSDSEDVSEFCKLGFQSSTKKVQKVDEDYYSVVSNSPSIDDDRKSVADLCRQFSASNEEILDIMERTGTHPLRNSKTTFMAPKSTKESNISAVVVYSQSTEL